jgi:phosphatidate cytidylyltransferase
LENARQPVKPGIWSDLAVRAASGVVMAVVAFTLIWIGGWPFNIMCVILGGLIFWEWFNIVKNRQHKTVWILVGLLYSILPAISLIYLRTGAHEFTALPSIDPRLAIVVSLIAAVIATDIGAYFAGRMIGGPKLAPSISPKKTWAGFFGGIVAAMAVGAFLQYFLPFVSAKFPSEPDPQMYLMYYFFNALLFCAPVSIISQIGDLFESWIKRKFDVKDSGTLIPGHGGFMDRLDGLIFAASALALYIFWQVHG